MCRMIGILSLELLSPSKYLIDDECSLLIQAKVGRQGDGWGIGYYVGGKLKVFKSAKPVYEEEELFRRMCSEIRSNIIVAHVRKASNPRGLPREELIGVRNSQPFYYGNYLFVHNGSIYVPDEIIGRLGRYKSLIKGVNDSEVYFAYLMKEWEELKDPLRAITTVEKGLWDALRKSGKTLKVPYSSLNTIFSDGRKLYALTLYLKDDKLSLCYKDSKYFELAFKAADEHLVVASERTDNGRWNRLDNGEILIAEVNNGRITYRIVKLFKI